MFLESFWDFLREWHSKIFLLCHSRRQSHNASLLFQLARSRPMGWLVRKVFATMSFAIPVDRLPETATLLAFHHPRPSYPVHVLLVPKREYRSLLDVPAEDRDFHRDLLLTVQSIVLELGLEQRGYRLITNGGVYQDVPILHFHLIAEG